MPELPITPITPVRLLFIDNLDSFTYILCDYLRRAGAEVAILRSDLPETWERSCALFERGEVEGWVLGPGPGTPSDYPLFKQLFSRWIGKFPFLGVCLGHQALAEYFGAVVKRAYRPMHGKRSSVIHTSSGLFFGLPCPTEVGRYHSLVVDGSTLPNGCQIDAWTEEGELMAFHSPSLLAYGVQFHPEAHATHEGEALLREFLRVVYDRRG
ncbi:MAG: aminodeoxychorismate/anthranilate synthase component II [Chlamydiia bacterium]|nr:aminodeoxychorismate/anthranilate synthase component II [Chlamydiia bacterium]